MPEYKARDLMMTIVIILVTLGLVIVSFQWLIQSVSNALTTGDDGAALTLSALTFVVSLVVLIKAIDWQMRLNQQTREKARR